MGPCSDQGLGCAPIQGIPVSRNHLKQSKSLGRAVTQAFTYAYLFLVQPKLLTMTLLVHYSSGKDNSVMQIHVVSALGKI